MMQIKDHGRCFDKIQAARIRSIISISLITSDTYNSGTSGKRRSQRNSGRSMDILIWSDFRDAKQPNPESWKTLLPRRKERSPITAFGNIQELALFFRWLLPGHEAVKFKPQKPRVDVPPEKVLQSDNIRGILGILRVPAGSCPGCRGMGQRGPDLRSFSISISGTSTLTGDGAVISVSGKTGHRNIRLVEPVPDLQAWINIHPLKGNPDAPLFVTSRRRGNTFSIPAHRAPGAEHLCPAGRSCRLSKGHQSPRIPARASYNPGQAAYRVRAPGVCRMVQGIEHGPGLCASVQPGYRQ